MKALVLAAGLGTRLRPLTLTVPKALVEVGGEPMLGRHLRALAQSGFDAAVVNASWLADAVRDYLGSHDFGLPVEISYEGESPLDTGGAMLHALPLLGAGPFAAVNADIVTSFDFSTLPDALGSDLAHLIMVPNPEYRSGGDFRIEGGRVVGRDQGGLTFSGIGVYDPELIQTAKGSRCFSIVPLLEEQMRLNRVSGAVFQGQWHDTGTPDRLAAARRSAATR